MAKPKVTPRYRRELRLIHHFIADFFAENGYSPTLREIREATGIRSTSTVASRLRDLEAEGVIERSDVHARSIRLLRLPSGEPLPGAAAYADVAGYEESLGRLLADLKDAKATIDNARHMIVVMPSAIRRSSPEYDRLVRLVADDLRVMSLRIADRTSSPFQQDEFLDNATQPQ